MIIVEGMDNTGKTTLIDQLSKDEEFSKFPLTVKKSPGAVTEDTLGSCLNWMVKVIKNQNPRLIYDRYSPISERVYGPVVRRGDMYGAYTFDLLRITLRRDPMIVYCRPPDAVIEKWGEREQMEGVKSRSKELLKRYDWIMEVLREMSCGKLLFIRYDYTQGSSAYHGVRAAVRTYLASHDERFEPVTEPTL